MEVIDTLNLHASDCDFQDIKEMKMQVFVHINK